MKPRLYVIPASPPCGCIEAALRLKGVAYDVTALPNILHIPHQLARFRAPTVPAIDFGGGDRVVGSRPIIRRLEAMVPDPPLHGDPEIEEAERWGDEELQPIGRRVAAWTTSRRPSAAPSFFEGANLVVPMPTPLLRVLAPGVTQLGRLRNGAGTPVTEESVRALPAALARVEAWLDAGVLGSPTPNAADLQIAPILRLLLVFDDLAPMFALHPRVEAFARELFPEWPGRVPAGVMPAAWVAVA